MEYVVGIVLGVAIAVFAALVGLDRDRAFYPTVLIVIASYYGLFAVMAGSSPALLAESVVMLVFVAVTVVGFRRNLWLVAAGILAHGVFDFFHGHFIANPGVPAWWPMFCMSIDVTLALCMAWRLWRPGVRAVAG